jgi:hypothetical protein
MTPLLTVLLLLAIAAFVCTVVAAMGKCPLWVAVVLLCIIELIRQLPLGR